MMTTLRNADRIPAADLRPHIEEAWRRQRAHVAANSPFYRALWNGNPPPETLRDLPELPLSDKSQLRAAQAAHPPFGDYLATPVSASSHLGG